MPQEMNLFKEHHVVKGQVAAIFFQNPSNFYKVVLVKVKETDLTLPEPEIVITGNFGQLQEGEDYEFHGETVTHPRYGLQFKAETYQKDQPTTAQGMVNYLSSDKFPGIGKITAEKIVSLFGSNTLEKILAHPEKLREIPSLTKGKQEMLIHTLRENLGMERVILGLTELGFGTQLAFAIYHVYEEEALEIVKENPYQLIEEVEGIGFSRADNLAERLEITADSPKRLQAAILFALENHTNQSGDTYLEAKELLVAAVEVLEKSRPVEMSLDKVANEMISLVEMGKVQQEGTRLFPNSLYFAEWGIVSSIERLLLRKKAIHYPKKELEKAFKATENLLHIHYGPSQKAAILKAIASPLFVLTGGPGTGKTTIVQGIVTMFAELNGLSLDLKDYQDKIFPILLGAPTGRAAKRLNEATGLPSGTIHRLLGLTGREKFPQASAKELEGGLLIIDEMSMVDTWLANTLLKTIPMNMQVIFVGDKDQLPSVGPGQVLHDLLAVDKIPQAELTEIYRQEDGSSIIPLAHAIKEGYLPEDFAKKQKDRSFIPGDAYHMEHLISQIAESAKRKNFSPQDIQVLAPMYKGPAGINALNKMLQEIFNGNPNKTKKEVQFMDGVYRIGDKVLQLVNDPELNVFNGDMGIIVGLTYAKDTEDKMDELVIEFDGGEVTYKRNEWHKITLSYCCSIHKSQGSEFEMVILPMVHQYSRMLQRNLLYTAVTRSKNLLILLGEQSAFLNCVNNLSATRNTTLVEKLQAEEIPQDKRLLLEYFEEHQMLNLVKETSENYNEENKEEKNSLKKNSLPEKKSVEKEKISLIPEKQVEEVSLFPELELKNNYQEKEKVVKEKVVEISDYRLTADNILLIDPMIGMDNLTPEKFM